MKTNYAPYTRYDENSYLSVTPATFASIKGTPTPLDINTPNSPHRLTPFPPLSSTTTLTSVPLTIPPNPFPASISSNSSYPLVLYSGYGSGAFLDALAFPLPPPPPPPPRRWERKLFVMRLLRFGLPRGEDLGERWWVRRWR